MRVWIDGRREADLGGRKSTRSCSPGIVSAEVMLPESCDDVVCVLVSMADRGNEGRKDGRWSFFLSFFFFFRSSFKCILFYEVVCN